MMTPFRSTGSIVPRTLLVLAVAASWCWSQDGDSAGVAQEDAFEIEIDAPVEAPAEKPSGDSVAPAAEGTAPAVEDDFEIETDVETPGDEDDSEIELDAPMGEEAGPAPEDSLPPIQTMPELKNFVEADYPADIYGQGIEGTVVMDLLVSDSGTVDSIAVVTGVHPVLNRNAVAAARQFEFSPAILTTGDSVTVLLQYAYQYSLETVVSKVKEYVNFSGRLTERGTRAPVPDALVVLRFADTTADTSLQVPFGAYLERLGEFDGQYIEEDRLVTVSDSDGGFSFKSLPAGPIEVTIPLAGYEEFFEREDIGYGEATEVVYYLRRMSYSDFEFTVYGKSEKKEVSKKQLTLNEVKKIPGLGGDAVKVVQALPGVARPTFGTAGIVVRGSPTSNSKFLLDGIEIPLLFHYGGIKSVYNSDALETVDFYPGGFGTRYGNVLGGVVEITGREAKDDRWHVTGDANFFDGVLFAEGPIGDKVSVLGSIRRSFIGDIISFALEQFPSSNVLTTAPFYWDYLFRTDVDINDKHSTYFTLFGVKDGFELISSDVRGGNEDIDDAKDRLTSHVLFHMGILGHDWKISDDLTNTFRYSLGYIESVTSAFGFFVSELDYVQHYLRDQFTLSRIEKLKINVGVDMQLAPVNLYLKIPTSSVRVTDVNDFLVGDVGVYLNLEYKPHERVLIMPGLRYDYFPELLYDGAVIPEFWNYQNYDNEGRWSGEPSLRLTTRYEFIDNHTAKFAVGNYSQTPQPLVQSLLDFYGNPNLSVSRAAHYVLGYEWQLTDLISLNVEGYINRQWKIPSSTGVIPPYDDSGKRKMMGLELMLRHDQGERFFGWLAYSLAKAEVWEAETGSWIPTDKDQTHNLIAVGNWRLPRNWEVGFRLQWTTGDPVTPIVGSELDVNYDFYYVENGPTNSDRLAPTFQLDLRIDKKFVFKKWMVAAYVDLFNIGYFLYKSPQLYIPNFTDPYNPETGEVYQTTAYQYSIPSIGLRVEF